MKEYNILDEKKKLAQFITPQKLREFIKDEFEPCESVFDCSVGSGQLLYSLNAKIKKGTDIDENAIEYAIENGIDAICRDFITMDNLQRVNAVVANYPFSLKATDVQKKHIENDVFYKPFLNKQGCFTGVLDYIFIIKSFLIADVGYYLCFAGIAYRSQEQKYRKWLIDNKFIEKVYLINNAGFNDTNIPILYLKLSKRENTTIEFAEIDFSTGNKVCQIVKIENVVKNEYNLSTSSYIDKDVEKEEIDIRQVEDFLTDCFKGYVKKHLEFDAFLYENNMADNGSFLAKMDFLIQTVDTYRKKIKKKDVKYNITINDFIGDKDD